VKIDWTDYLRVHASRTNLAIHLVAVPMFISAFVLIVLYVIRGEYQPALLALVPAMVAMVLQGIGHRKESEPPRPFSGPLNFMRRWFSEQFVIFPLFFLTGRWWKQYGSAGNNAGHDA